MCIIFFSYEEVLNTVYDMSVQRPRCETVNKETKNKKRRTDGVSILFVRCRATGVRTKKKPPQTGKPPAGRSIKYTFAPKLEATRDLLIVMSE